MAEIFISYSRADRDRVEKIALALQRSGYDVWWDRHISGGVDFSAETESQLEEAKAVVVVWSQASLHSIWVADEATVGRDKGILIPIAIDAVQPKLGFRQFQTIDFSAWRGDEKARSYEELLAALTTRLTGEPPPARESPRKRASPVARGAVIGAAALALCVLVVAAAVFGKTFRHFTPPVDRSVAVLPFAVLSSGADDSYFADGLAEEISNSLAVLPDLLVAARTSAFHFKGQQKTIPEIAAALNVAHIVEGSIRRSARDIRVSVQLVRASDGFQLWSETFDAPLSDDFSLQSEIAEKVASSLGVLLDDAARMRMADARVSDVEAFTAYQKGARLWYDAHGIGPLLPGLIAANVEFDKAIALEPRFADAQLMHSDLHFHAFETLILGGELPPPLSEYDAEKHLGLFRQQMAAAVHDARTPGRRAMAEYALAFASDDWTGLGSKLDAAFRSEECVYIHWAASAAMFGRSEAALAFAKRRNVCDPFDPGAYATIAHLQMRMADYASARDTLARAKERLGPRRAYEMSEFEIAALSQDEAAFTSMKERFSASDGFAGAIAFLTVMRALSGKEAASSRKLAREAIARTDDELEMLMYAAWLGDEDLARRLAASIDRSPYGAYKLLDVVAVCACGSPFPPGSAPHFDEQLLKAGIAWPPLSGVKWPLKTWS